MASGEGRSSVARYFKKYPVVKINCRGRAGDCSNADIDCRNCADACGSASGDFCGVKIGCCISEIYRAHYDWVYRSVPPAVGGGSRLHESEPARSRGRY